MTLSTNELFHFTKFEYLKGILESKAFFPRYCLEFTFLSDDFGRKAALLPVAMTCFCDIPFHLSETHRKRYGNHAIVMTEDWKLKKELNPVFYIQPNSDIARVLANFTDSTNDHISLIKDENNDIKVAQSLGRVSRNLTRLSYYLKQFENKEEVKIEYAGKMRKFEKRRFYDEREWRYIPFPENFFFLPLSIQEFDDQEKLNQANKRLEKYKLSFEFEDVKFLLVETEHEKKELEKLLGNTVQTPIEIRLVGG